MAEASIKRIKVRTVTWSLSAWSMMLAAHMYRSQLLYYHARVLGLLLIPTSIYLCTYSALYSMAHHTSWFSQGPEVGSHVRFRSSSRPRMSICRTGKSQNLSIFTFPVNDCMYMCICRYKWAHRAEHGCNTVRTVGIPLGHVCICFSVYR